jgi:hypothetical protein
MSIDQSKNYQDSEFQKSYKKLRKGGDGSGGAREGAGRPAGSGGKEMGGGKELGGKEPAISNKVDNKTYNSIRDIIEGHFASDEKDWDKDTKTAITRYVANQKAGMSNSKNLANIGDKYESTLWRRNGGESGM